MTKWLGRALVAAILLIAAAGIVGVVAHAQQMGHSHDMSGGMGPMAGRDAGAMPMMSGQGGISDMMRSHGAIMQGFSGAGVPSMPGQDAFGAMQEMVRILDADPKTDWSKVDLEALRQHLIDMNEVTLHAEATATLVEGGLRISVTGSGRTVGSIQRMVKDHSAEIDATHLNKWSVKTEPQPNGVILTVTSSDPAETAHIRGLGFIGIMASGAHHQVHHLAMARGERGIHGAPAKAAE